VELSGPIASNRNELDRMRSAPELSGNHKGIDPLALPPGALVAAPVQFAMVEPAHRDGEAVADLAAHCLLFGKSDVMGIRGGPATDETSLSGHKSQMVAVALPHRFADDRDLLRVGLTQSVAIRLWVLGHR